MISFKTTTPHVMRNFFKVQLMRYVPMSKLWCQWVSCGPNEQCIVTKN